MDEVQDIRLPPWDMRGLFEFFIVYRDDPEIPAIRIQLEDGRTYDIYQEHFGRVPQITRLPKWEECFRLACANGASVYIFGSTEAEDSVESAPSERKPNEPLNVTRGLRDNAIRGSRIQRITRGGKNIGPRGGAASRYR